MPVFALSPWWNDFYAVGGFYVGVVGLFVGVAGFWIAIAQIRETRKTAEAGRKAAEAAREAANKTLEESKEAYSWFVGTFASRLLAEAEAAARAKSWGVVQFRCIDLAELVASLPATGVAAIDDGRPVAVTNLRELGLKFGELAGVAALPTATARKWARLCRLLHAQLDHLRKPFREARDG